MRPLLTDVPPFYRLYLERTTGTDYLRTLKDAKLQTLKTLKSIGEEKANDAYAENKWSIKSLVQHIVDSEVVFGYRALWIVRNAEGDLQGFEQDDWVKAELENDKTFSSVLENFSATRNWTISLFSNMSEIELMRTGNANGFKIKALILPYLIAGHNLHHLDIIKSRYL